MVGWITLPSGGSQSAEPIGGGSAEEVINQRPALEKLAEGFDGGILQVTEPTQKGQFRIRPHIHL